MDLLPERRLCWENEKLQHNDVLDKDVSLNFMKEKRTKGECKPYRKA